MKDNQEKTLDELREELGVLEGLVLHPGWKLLSEYNTFELNEVRDAIESSPLSSLDAALQQEYVKGRIFELKVGLTRPQIHIDNLKREIEGRVNSQGEEDEEQGS